VGETAVGLVSTNRGLAVMIARAHRWRDLLEGGQYPTIRALAADLGVDNSYVARILRLTLLAPDLIEAILAGTEPDGLSLERLYRAPVGWEEQRYVLGDSAGSHAGVARDPDGRRDRIVLSSA
jgi:hypothetical protein